MKTKCYSVKLKNLDSISEKAYLAIAFDGSQEVIPKSQVFGVDHEVVKSDAYWISCWILKQKNLQYTTNKAGWYNPSTGKIEPHFEVEHIKPNKIEFFENQPHDDRLNR